MRAVYRFGVLLVTLALAGCNPGFTDADIEAAKKSIKEEFEKKPGITVSDVTLLKESQRKLTGFVKLRVMSQDIMKSCSATMDDTGKNYIWRCD